MYPKVHLKPAKSEAAKRFHPWVFSGAIQTIETQINEGDIVEVFVNNQYIATGHFQPQNSIAVKLFCFKQQPINENFWIQQISNAYHYRTTLGITNNQNTNVFRLINGEGDNCSGLIIDFYNGTAVIQCHSVGMYYCLNHICTALQKILGHKLIAIYNKSTETLPKNIIPNLQNQYLLGSLSQNTVTENNCKFIIDWEQGQKTGFFIDQRNNRQLISQYTHQKTVLNAFAYSGGFSIYAAIAGASKVYSVDSSKKAIELCQKNAELNNLDASKMEHICSDVMPFLQNSTQSFDVMVLDPPAFAKHMHNRHQAVQGYIRLNERGMSKINPNGGILFTFSCSQVVDRLLFYNSIRAAAILAKRTVRILHQLSAPPDHPTNMFHPEGEYLKGLVLFVQ